MVTVAKLKAYAVIYNVDCPEDDLIIQDVLTFVLTTVDLYQKGAPETISDLAILRFGAYILQRDQSVLWNARRSNVFSLSGARGMLKPYAHRRAVAI